jgi:hypothetical protein
MFLKFRVRGWLEIVRQFRFWMMSSLLAGDNPHSIVVSQSEQTEHLRKWGTKCPRKFVEQSLIETFTAAWIGQAFCVVWPPSSFVFPQWCLSRYCFPRHSTVMDETWNIVYVTQGHIIFCEVDNAPALCFMFILVLISELLFLEEG